LAISLIAYPFKCAAAALRPLPHGGP
jgi:hypothetical protein